MGGQQKDLSHFTVSRLWPLSQVWLLSWTQDETNVVATTEHSIWICLCLYFITFCLIWVFIEKFSFLQISECSSYWTHIWGHAADGSSLQAELTIHGRPGGIPENKHQTQVTTFYTCMQLFMGIGHFWITTSFFLKARLSLVPISSYENEIPFACKLNSLSYEWLYIKALLW